MLSLTVTVDTNLTGLENASTLIKHELDRASEESGLILEAAAKANAMTAMRTRTGNLLRGIGHDVSHDPLTPGIPTWRVSVTVSSLVPYGKYLEFGTGVYHLSENYLPAPRPPWVIVPRRAKALRWHDSFGQPVFARRVVQFGMRPHSFIRPAARESQALVLERYQAAVHRFAMRA